MIHRAFRLLFGVCMAIGLSAHAAADTALTNERVFELRTYTAAPGKLEELHQRFRQHTLKLFERHGMENIGYWSPSKDASSQAGTIIYLLAHQSKAAAEQSWAAFRADPEWQKVKSTSEANGSLVTKVESSFLDPTDYSPMR